MKKHQKFLLKLFREWWKIPEHERNSKMTWILFWLIRSLEYFPVISFLNFHSIKSSKLELWVNFLKFQSKHVQNFTSILTITVQAGPVFWKNNFYESFVLWIHYESTAVICFAHNQSKSTNLKLFLWKQTEFEFSSEMNFPLFLHFLLVFNWRLSSWVFFRLGFSDKKHHTML